MRARREARRRGVRPCAQAEFLQRKRDATLYSGGGDGKLRLWNVSSGECMKTIETGSYVNAVAATQGNIFTSHDDGTVREWSAKTGEQLRTFSHPGTDVYVIATATHLYSSSRHQKSVVKEWNLQTAECTRELPAPNSGDGVWVMPVFAQGRTLFAPASEDESSAAEYSLDSGERVRSYTGHGARLNALFATTQRLFTGSMDGTLKEWSRATGDCVCTFGSHPKRIVALNILVVGDLLCSPLSIDTVGARSLKTGALVQEWKTAGMADRLAALEGHLYACTTGKVHKLSLSTGELVDTYDHGSAEVFGIAFQFSDD